MNPATILVVDDEPDVLRTFVVRLETAGFDVLTAFNGANALETLRERRVDLVLADFMMPEMNGIELTRTVKSHPLWFDTKVLLFSCNPEPEFRRKAIELGAEDYLSKTIGAAAIVERVCDLAPCGASEEHEFRQQLASLSKSLVDMLHLADTTANQPEASGFALESAKRIAEDIRRISSEEEHERSVG